MEEIMRALGEGLKELGFDVEAYRDSDDLPFVLEIGKPGLLWVPPYYKQTKKKTLVLAEDRDMPGYLEVCTDNDDLHNLTTIELANPNSIDEIVQILHDYLVDDTPPPSPHRH